MTAIVRPAPGWQTVFVTIGLLHPGAMGASLGAALVDRGHQVVWAAQHRSRATRTRAQRVGLVDVGTLAALVERSDTILSVCPPAEALTVAHSIAALGFTGVYLDANAVAPATARAVAATVGEAGAAPLDGGIIGPPAGPDGLTVLYLSGDRGRSDAVAQLFAGGPLRTVHVGDSIGAASAVKIGFAAWTKGTSALLLAVRAFAEAEGVVDGVDHAWSTLTPELIDRLPATAAGTGPKAWRFVGEMREIATAFGAAGLPSGFHTAAAEVYAALADLRDHDRVEIAQVVQRLLEMPADG